MFLVEEVMEVRSYFLFRTKYNLLQLSRDLEVKFSFSDQVQQFTFSQVKNS